MNTLLLDGKAKSSFLWKQFQMSMLKLSRLFLVQFVNITWCNKCWPSPRLPQPSQQCSKISSGLNVLILRTTLRTHGVHDQRSLGIDQIKLLVNEIQPAIGIFSVHIMAILGARLEWLHGHWNWLGASQCLHFEFDTKLFPRKSQLCLAG